MSPDRHVLDDVVWNALTSRQAQVALGDGRRALRFDPAFGVFAATADDGAESLAALAALVRAHGDVALLQPAAAPCPQGLAVVSEAAGVQMVASALAPAEPPCFTVTDLTDDDGPEMLALATLTEPGPFFARTHQLGAFVVVKLDGRLVAMAGERMKPAGFTEVSGVCTHPDHRGRGYAGGLMRIVAGRILARGETPFLHAYASNTAAIALYEALGFSLRTMVIMTRLTAA